MFGRLNVLVRQLSRPIPNYAHTSAAGHPATLTSPFATSKMASMLSPLEKSRRKISTAACLIIGDEVLGGKTVDTNSAFFSRYCFSIGIQLKRIEVIADDEAEIMEAVRRLSDDYDFVVTSGGIGPTHDDITYESIAKAFNLKQKLHEKALDRMKRLSKPTQAQPSFDWDTPSPSLTAKLRMVMLPVDETLDFEDQYLFTTEDLWVPISVVNGNVYILPGVPGLFERLLGGLKPILLPRLLDPEGKGIHRFLFATPLSESTIAPYLTELAERVEPHGVKVGSYPRWGKKRNTVTLVGTDLEYMEALIGEVEKNVGGRKVTREDEDDGNDDEEAAKEVK